MELYVSNLSFDVSDAEFRETFTQIGEVRRATLVKDRETGQSRGFGFVEMPDADGQQAIAKLDGVSLQGREMRVSEARPRGARPTGSSHGGHSGPREGGYRSNSRPTGSNQGGGYGGSREGGYRPNSRPAGSSQGGYGGSREGGYRPNSRPAGSSQGGGYGGSREGGYRPSPRPPAGSDNLHLPVVDASDLESVDEDRPPRRQIKTKEKPKNTKGFGKNSKRKPGRFEDGGFAGSKKGGKGKSSLSRRAARFQDDDDDEDNELF